MLLLVGKDGSVKRRATLTTDLREIVHQIDAMPMRHNESRERNNFGEPVTPPSFNNASGKTVSIFAHAARVKRCQTIACLSRIEGLANFLAIGSWNLSCSMKS
jgi:hypothetical protein